MYQACFDDRGPFKFGALEPWPHELSTRPVFFPWLLEIDSTEAFGERLVCLREECIVREILRQELV